ncbi:hypothetical protein P278_28100 [Zhouia amylolytica AD3]|uniref:Phage integrase SAM-like domain-containing protein n=2 Tax=Zhouia amylolytica TaxID=376730 RepID=W2UKN3_9FLAO|nr:hypothetical protein P278_28100 [Zhouia amylolytica AD3]
MHFASKGKRFKKSIGYKCSLSPWDFSKQRIKTGKGMLTNAYKVNAFINGLQTFAEDCLSTIIKDNDSIDIDKLSTIINNKINGCDDENTKRENQKVINYAKNLIESKKSRIKITTFRSCNQTIKMLEKYQDSHNTILRFDEINLSFYRKFVTLLENENYSFNSIGKHIKNLKIFLNDALINGISTSTIFKNRSFKVLKEVTTEIYLTEEEILKLSNKDFSNRPRIELARDIFFIGCYTGQRVSD